MLNVINETHLPFLVEQNFSNTLVFIDSLVENFENLINALHSGVRVIRLNSCVESLQEITSHLQALTQQHIRIDTLHIISHGRPGCLRLGNLELNQQTLDDYQKEWQQWQKLLSDKASILLYGCEIAQGEGVNFVRQLSQSIKANIAASSSLTGSTEKGGNWNLEFATADISIPSIFNPEKLAEYPGILAILEVKNTNDSGTGSLREAIAQAQSGDTITFASTLANSTITLSSGQLNLNKNLIIDGSKAPNLTLSGNNTHRVFEIKPYLDATLKNLKITQGFSSEDGGGVFLGAHSNLTLRNMTFSQNQAVTGGAILAANDTQLTITNSSFTSNQATSNISAYSGGTGRGGGAITVLTRGQTLIQNSAFTNNQGFQGGAINNLLGSLIVENTTFKNNSSKLGDPNDLDAGGGGAIFVDGASDRNNPDSGIVTIRNSTFDGNQARGDGGAAFIFLYSPDKTQIENSKFINNFVENNANNAGLGGAIRHGGEGELSINKSSFANNRAEKMAGALFIDATKATVTNSTFSANYAGLVDQTGLGGAISTTSATTITNATFVDNEATSAGGAIFAALQPQLPPVTLTNSLFVNNTVKQSQKPSNVELINGGNNLQFPAPDANGFLVTANTLVADPKLGSLQEINGAFVHPLLVGSAAIDAGKTTSLATDQRGQTRVDANGDGIAQVDIGAYEFVGTSTPVTPAKPLPKFDYNSDGKADILWRNPIRGQSRIWLMNNERLTTLGIYDDFDPKWDLLGVGDLNGDRKSDLIWRNPDSGQNQVWLMDGITATSKLSLNDMADRWDLAQVDDFNGDGKDDIFWRNITNGQNRLWLMNGASVTTDTTVDSMAPLWKKQQVGDFNGDGKADILWRNPDSGQNRLWLMNGASITTEVTLDAMAPSWQDQQVGDFNGDGKTDILWRDPESGQNRLWLMNGSTITSQETVTARISGWDMSQVDDFNGDGKADILWHNSTTGENIGWFMDGNTITRQGDIPDYPAVWNVLPLAEAVDPLLGTSGVANTFELGKASTLLYNKALSDDYALLMNVNAAEGDKIQLHGTASSYRLAENVPGFSAGTAIYYTPSEPDELIGVVKDVTGLQLSSNTFSFV